MRTSAALGDIRCRDNFAAYDAEILARRAAARGEKVANGGVAALVEMAAATEFADMVGIALAEHSDDHDQELLFISAVQRLPRTTARVHRSHVASGLLLVLSAGFVVLIRGQRSHANARLLTELPIFWADLLRDCRRRGMHDPMLVVGDGAMGLWRALAEVFPQARHQRCWVHKTRNVSNALPKSAQPGAKKALQEIYNAEDRAHAEKAVTAFEKAYGAKFPKAVKKITGEVDELLAFYDFPAEHWIHLRTTNPIESTFSTVKLRTKVTRGAGSPAAALAMVFKLVESAQARWRAITAPHLVALVRAGARFEGGHLAERREEIAV